MEALKTTAQSLKEDFVDVFLHMKMENALRISEDLPESNLLLSAGCLVLVTLAHIVIDKIAIVWFRLCLR